MNLADEAIGTFERLGDLAEMIGRNPKVALELAPSALRGYILKEGEKNTFSLNSPHKTLYDWTYANEGNPAFRELYHRAYKGQWSAQDLPWETSVDPEDLKERYILPEKLSPIYNTPLMSKDPKDNARLMHDVLGFLLSQFLHGEQGALYAAAFTVEATPWFGAKLYGATQVMDEGRHVEVFSKYIREKLQRLYPVNDNLFVVLHALHQSPDWDIKFLGMQIMIEGLALGAFGLFYKFTKEPLLKELLRLVISDEARHVHYGVEALRDYYTKEVSETLRREREDWAYEIAVMLRNRFLFYEIRDKYFAGRISRKGWEKMILESEIMREFRRVLFSRLIPNLKAIGLLTDRIRPKYEQLGVIEFEHMKSADRLSLAELLAA
ncbi:MAG: ferritin-like domain-containing protein [Leptospiraceae bacterium]|nr:ferritin-like domain-containing protein [Leptospiraceae bacterium]MDW8305787.1 ferritin-like domain-containing protein [Leptospiraceae bacterium]